MLGLFELFSVLLEFLISHLNMTVTWLSPFRIRVQNHSEFNVASPTIDSPITLFDSGLGAMANANQASNLVTDVTWTGIGRFLQFNGYFISADNTLNNAADNSLGNDLLNPVTDYPSSDRSSNSETIETSSCFDFVLAVGEAIKLSDHSSEHSPYWYGLIADLDQDSFHPFSPVGRLLEPMYLFKTLCRNGENESVAASALSLEGNSGEIQGTPVDRIDVMEVINSRGLTRYRALITVESNSNSNLDSDLDEKQIDELSVATSLAVQSNRYNSSYGYGLVDANAAVATVLGQSSTFPEIADLGGNNWGLDAVNAPEVWSQGYTGQGVVVAVVDSGVDYTHPDLNGNVWFNPNEIIGNNIDDDGNGYVDDIRGWDFVGNDNNPIDEEGHGTAVAGIIAAENDGTGTVGVAYDAEIMPIRVLDQTGSGNFSDVAAGVYYAVNNGADIINLSLGGDVSPELVEAIEYATEQGSLVVMAAGNDGSMQLTFPAVLSTEYGVSVGAVDQDGTIADFSNRSGIFPTHYLLAPGVDIVSTTPDNSYAVFSGTSAATPYVSGVAALILSADSALIASSLDSLLTGTAADILA